MIKLFYFAVFCNLLLFPYGDCSFVLEKFKNLKSRTSPSEQVQAVQNLIKRLFPTRANEFVLDVNEEYFNVANSMDAFEYVSESDGKINVKGTSGVALAAGVYHFLKYYCNIHVSWSGDQLNLPNPLPIVTTAVRINFLDR